MPRRASPRLIGLFVLGGLALLAAALLGLGGGHLLQRRPQAVAFFQGSVKGLQVGAPVSFRGVPIGNVTAIQLRLDPSSLEAEIPVYMEFDPDSLHSLEGSLERGRVPLKAAIDKGLRARLVAQSYVTGQLSVEIDFHPDTPATLVGADPHTPEIPTIKSPLEEVQETLQRLPVQELANGAMRTLDRLNHTLEQADALLASPQLPAILQSLAAGSGDFAGMMGDLRPRIGPLAEQSRSDLAALHQTLEDLDRTILLLQRDAHGAAAQLGPVLDDSRATLAAAEKTFRQAETTLASLNGMVGPTSRGRADIDQILRSLADASRSLSQLAEQLNRNPNSLLLGRGDRR